MHAYPLAKAKHNLSRLVDEALAGETVTITRHGKEVVELRPVAESGTERKISQELKRLRARRKARPPLGEDSVALLRAMRGYED